MPSCRCWYYYDEENTVEVMAECPVHGSDARNDNETDNEQEQ